MNTKFPESEKLNQAANVQTTLMEFTEWLEYNDYEIRNYKTLKTAKMSDLIYEFMKVDTKKLEEERRKMIANLPK